MKKINEIRRFSTTALAVLALLASAAASHPDQDTQEPPPYRDYLDGGDGGAMTAVGEAECRKPLSEREGAWLCFDESGSASGSMPDPPSQQAARADDRGHHPLTYCLSAGCWTRYYAWHSDFSGRGWYGYGQERLGDIRWFYDIRFNGSQSRTTHIWFQSTRDVSNLTFVGDRLYISAKYPEGNPVNDGDQYRSRWVGHVSAGTTATWPEGYRSFENTTSYASIVHQVTWQDPDPNYPGRWFFYAKSIIAERKADDFAVWYDFMTEQDLPDLPFGSGWRLE